MSLADNPDVDRGWAWVVLGAACFAVFLNGFVGYSAGVLTTAMLDQFGEDLAKTSAAGSLMIAMQCLSGPLVGLIINRLGCRTTTFLGGILCVVGMTGASLSTSLNMVLLTFGVLVGLGLGLGYIPAIVVVGHYFHRLRPFACGVTVAGGGLGMIVGPPFVRMVTDFYGLSGAFLIMGAVTTHFCVIGLLMRISPLEVVAERNRLAKKRRRRETHACGSCCCFSSSKSSEEEKIKTNDFTEKSETDKNTAHHQCDIKQSKRKKLKNIFNTFSNRPFVCFVLSIAAWNAGEAATLVHLPNYITQQGFSRQHAASLYMAMGLANIPSRLLTGYATNDSNISGLSLLIGQMGIAAILTMTFPLYSDSYTGQLLFVIGLGVYISGINSLMNPLTVELLGLEHLANGFGIVMLMAGIGYLSGAPIAGIIVDRGGTYTQSYMFAGSLYLLSSIMGLSCAFFQTAPDKKVADKHVTLLVEEQDVLVPLTTSHDVNSSHVKTSAEFVQRDLTLLVEESDVLVALNTNHDISCSPAKTSSMEFVQGDLTLLLEEPNVPYALNRNHDLSSSHVKTSSMECVQRDVLEEEDDLDALKTDRNNSVTIAEDLKLNRDHIRCENSVTGQSNKIPSLVS